MNKTNLLFLIVLIVFLGLFFNYKKNQVKNNFSNNGFSNKMSGVIKEVRKDPTSIVVEGRVISDSVQSEVKIIEFFINSETIIDNTLYVTKKEQLLSGKQFSPEIRKLPNTFSNLKVDDQVRSIISKENLLKKDRATAKEIYIVNFELPTISPKP